MSNIILMAIGILSIGITIGGNIKAYTIGKYNPYIFRLRKGYEWKLIYMISYFGCYMPTIFIQGVVSKAVYVTIIMVSIYLSMVVLNYKCFKSNRDTRILLETLIVGRWPFPLL